MAGKKGKSGTSPNSINNLTNIADNVTREDCKKNGKKGGIASGKARRERRDIQKRIQDIFDMTIAGGKEGEFTNLAEASGQNLSVMDACILKQVQKAMKGDTRAMEFLRDSAGMRPVERQEVTTEFRGSDKLADILSALQEDDEDD
jgi:hypothetical protein